jgi:hypothetical protein
MVKRRKVESTEQRAESIEYEVDFRQERKESREQRGSRKVGQ